MPGSRPVTMDRTVLAETIGHPRRVAVVAALRKIAAVDGRGVLSARPSM